MGTDLIVDDIAVNERTATPLDTDESFILKGGERLARGHPADRKALGNLALGGDRSFGRVSPCKDFPAQRIDHDPPHRLFGGFGGLHGASLPAGRSLSTIRWTLRASSA